MRSRSHLDDALNKWSALTNNSNFPTSSSVQKQWDQIQASNIYQTLLSSSMCEADQARFHAIKQKESGTWLQTIPSPNIGTLIDSKSFRIAVGLRLGIKICFPHNCQCGAFVDSYGHHGLSGAKRAGRHPRHFQINDILKRALISAGFPSILEPSGLHRSDGKRPDGLTLIPWSRGKSLLWDVTCVDTFPICLQHPNQQVQLQYLLLIQNELSIENLWIITTLLFLLWRR